MSATKFILVLFLIFILSCTPTHDIINQDKIVCNSPYIRFEQGCCLDNNVNSICDTDEVSENDVSSQKIIFVHRNNSNLLDQNLEIFNKILNKSEHFNNYQYYEDAREKAVWVFNSTKAAMFFGVNFISLNSDLPIYNKAPEVYAEMGLQGKNSIKVQLISIGYDLDTNKAIGYYWWDNQSQHKIGEWWIIKGTELNIKDFPIKTPVSWLTEVHNTPPQNISYIDYPDKIKYNEPLIVLRFNSTRIKEIYVGQHSNFVYHVRYDNYTNIVSKDYFNLGTNWNCKDADMLVSDLSEGITSNWYPKNEYMFETEPCRVYIPGM